MTQRNLGGVYSLDDIKARCVIDEAGCWRWAHGMRGQTPVAYLYDAENKCSVKVNARRQSVLFAGRKIRQREYVMCRTDCCNECVNPAHLRICSYSELCQAYAARGSYGSPERVANLRRASIKQRKTNDAQRLEIRLSDRPLRELAAEYGIAYNTVKAIRCRKRRKTPVSSVFNLGA